jgi:hypothetical protein
MKKLFIFVSFVVFAFSVTPQTLSLQSTNQNGAAQKAGNHPEIEQKAQALAATSKRQPFFGTGQTKPAKEMEAVAGLQAKRLQSVRAAGNRPASTAPKMNVKVKKSAVPDAATVTLNVVGDPFGDGTGFQMFLDPDCELDWQQILSYPEFFEVCEYRLPSDATSDFATTNVVLNQATGITIPQGTYNLIILNIYRDWEQAFAANWADNYDVAAGDGFHFKNGYEYVLLLIISSMYNIIPNTTSRLPAWMYRPLRWILRIANRLPSVLPIAARLITLPFSCRTKSMEAPLLQSLTTHRLKPEANTNIRLTLKPIYPQVVFTP